MVASEAEALKGYKHRSRRAAMLAATLAMAPIDPLRVACRCKADRAAQAAAFELAIGRTTGSGSAPRRPQTSGTRSGCCDPAPSQHDATLLVHCMHGRRQMTATRRPVMGSVVTIGSVRMIHPLSQRGSGQGINLARFGQPSLFKSPGRRFGSRANILRAAFRCQSRRFP
jgi:hypothetical protein